LRSEEASAVEGFRCPTMVIKPLCAADGSQTNEKSSRLFDKPWCSSEYVQLLKSVRNYSTVMGLFVLLSISANDAVVRATTAAVSSPRLVDQVCLCGSDDADSEFAERNVSG
jgi:hypothetical protein